MKIRLVIPDVNGQPTDRPDACRACGHWRLHRHGRVPKPVRDHRLAEVMVERYKCAGCGRTFRHYPSGITRQDQSQRTVVLAALLYGFGLSCAASAAILSAIGAAVGRMSVWRDAQAVGEVLRQRRPAGTVRVLGADETVFRVRGTEVLVGFVVDAQQGQTLGFEVLYAGEAQALLAWLRPYADALDVEVLVSDGHEAYGVVATELGLEHQLCLAHVRKAVARQRRSLRTQVQDEESDEATIAQVLADVDTIRALVHDVSAQGLATLWRMHRRYLAHPPPRKGETASVGYRMRMLSLKLIEQWDTLRLARARPELGLDGTNNATERAIGKSKLRYKTMRGYKSLSGMRNGIALTQYLYRGAAELNLAEVLAA
jgi:transposase-like protein